MESEDDAPVCREPLSSPRMSGANPFSPNLSSHHTCMSGSHMMRKLIPVCRDQYHVWKVKMTLLYVGSLSLRPGIAPYVGSKPPLSKSFLQSYLYVRLVPGYCGLRDVYVPSTSTFYVIIKFVKSGLSSDRFAHDIYYHRCHLLAQGVCVFLPLKKNLLWAKLRDYTISRV